MLSLLVAFSKGTPEKASQKRKKAMKGRIARITLGTLFIAAVCMSVASAAQAQGRACSLTLAAGEYATSETGTVIGLGPWAAVGLLTVDAAGNSTGKKTGSLNGNLIQLTFSATITLNPDCSGSANWSQFDPFGNLFDTGTLEFVMDDNMNEFHYVLTSVQLPGGAPTPPHIIGGVARKLFQGNSNQQ